MDPKAARLQQIGQLIHPRPGWMSRLAADLGVTPQHISAIMSGSRRVTPDLEEALARRLNSVTIPHLIAMQAQLRVLVSDIAEELELDLEPPAMTMG